MATYATLRIGSKGNDVKKLQQALGITADGIYGSQTAAAVKNYQKKNGLDVDGIVGKNTWASLNGNNSSNSTKKNTVKKNTDTGFKYDPYKESDAVINAKNAYNNILANKPGEYQSTFQSQIDDTVNKILNREKFSYDFNSDALYQQYKDKYIQQGKMAMQDTMGQAAALTGGYGNSYAATAGNQAYQSSLQNLNDIIPELYQLAYDRYNQEGQDLKDQYALLSDRENIDYSRYRDTFTDWQNDRNYYADRYDNERNFDYSQYGDNKSYAYQQYRDNTTDEQWKKEFDEAQRQFNEKLALSKKKISSSSSSGGSGGSGGDKDNGGVIDDDEPKKMTADDYADWNAGDWEAYFANIRNTPAKEGGGKDAAIEELNEFLDKGFIPKNMVYFARIGARGSFGH